ncbi:hypothetical protein B0H67DRAFT_648664 [Lasiosphaeris hirsuta]|uniref:Uncharacterized protein n=1 Tax=Lasiosphaeris hirsuta TaxID=260670 RepID=A0AA40A3P0_9PEZI|nr:hypothetical protein B0H67DRAFT_648664 [Lasiosphaeris hirsuta]
MRHHRSGSESPSIKAGMAANFGSSLFLFQGLPTISPHILNEAALQPQHRSSRQTPQDYHTMGNLNRSKSRRGWFSSSPKPSKNTDTPPCESFLLELQCTTCRRRSARTGHKESCAAESDFNCGGGRAAFLERGAPGGTGRPGKFKHSGAARMEERVLALDLCDFANYSRVTRTKEVLKRHMGDRYVAAEQGRELEPVNVRVLLEALRAQGIAAGEPEGRGEFVERW